jgi:hypothetical protein
MLAAAVCVWSWAAQASLAQVPRSMHYEPTYPTLSPWFRMYTSNTGPLDNYHTYVRPEMLMREMIVRQNTINYQNAAHIASLRTDVTSLTHDTTVRPTGTSSVFMDYSHYYGQTPTRPTARR